MVVKQSYDHKITIILRVNDAYEEIWAFNRPKRRCCLDEVINNKNIKFMLCTILVCLLMCVCLHRAANLAFRSKSVQDTVNHFCDA